MGFVVQVFKVLRNLVHVEMSKRCPKTGFFAAFLIQTRFFCRGYGPWELACEFCILIYAKFENACN